MKRVIIIQARSSSTRLPGKVSMELAGQSMLTQQIRRLKLCRLADEIVIATTINDCDDPLVAIAEAENVRWFRGHEHDVLGRYNGAARESHADIVVRVTSDCPLIDPEQTDRVIEALVSRHTKCDYASNVMKRTFPRGLDTEAFFRDTLERLDRLADSVPAREHVTYFLTVERPDLFMTQSVSDDHDNSDLRWTVDTLEDLEMVRRIYADLGMGEQILPYRDVLAHVRKNPGIAMMNAQVRQKRL